MALSDDRRRLVDEVGETDDGRIAANAGPLLALWAHKDLIKPGLARLYAKRQLIELALGYERGNVDFQQLRVLEVKAGQAPDRLLVMYEKTLAEIIRMECKARGRRAGASLALTTTTPASPPWPAPPFPDANSPRLKGDPYVRPLFGRDSGIP